MLVPIFARWVVYQVRERRVSSERGILNLSKRSRELSSGVWTADWISFITASVTVTLGSAVHSLLGLFHKVLSGALFIASPIEKN